MSQSTLDLSKPVADSDCAVPFDKMRMALWKIEKFSTKFASSATATSCEANGNVFKFKLSYFKDKFSSSTFVIVQFVSIEKHLSVHYRMSLLDAVDNQHFIQESTATHQSSNGVFNFSIGSIVAPESGLLIDDTLKICCDVVEFVNHDHQQVVTSKVLQDYDSLLEGSKFADVVLVVGKGRAKKEFHAHKAILAARSPVFGAMFQHKNTKEAQESRVVITDVCVDAFEQFMRFVYTGKVIEMDKYAPYLLTIADKYQMDCLKTLCSHNLSSRLTAKLVSSILVLADFHNAAELKSNCVDYFVDHADEVMATEDFNLHIKNKPELLIDLLKNHVKKFKK